MRDLFLLEPGLVFLNHGSFGACPREVFEQHQRWQLELERNPVHFLGRRSGELLAQARQALGAYLGAQPDDLAFVPNATTGVNIVARSIALAPGDEVLATDHEYGACDATWQRVCAAAGAHYRRIELPLPFEPGRFVERMMAAVGPRTRLLFASHITSTTALVFPLTGLVEAAHAAGVPVLVDGAHAPGQLPLDLDTLGADFYTGNCHKWLCAPKGAAFLHARPEWQERLQPPVVSWGLVAEGLGGHTGFDSYTGRTPLQRRLQWQGTRDIAPYLSVAAAIEFQHRHGWTARRAECRALALATRDRARATSGLPDIAPDVAHAQMVPIPVRTSAPEALRDALFTRHRIEVPVTQHAGHTFVRLSVQAYNTPAEMDHLLAALHAEGVLQPAG